MGGGVWRRNIGKQGNDSAEKDCGWGGGVWRRNIGKQGKIVDGGGSGDET